MVLEITKEPDAVLRRRASEVDINTIRSAEMNKLIKDMKDTMKAANGIGIAAPQVGKGIRVIIVLGPDGPFGVFNPKIEKHSLRVTASEEGCLSVPKKYGIVKRYRKAVVSGYDEQGEFFKAEATEMLAIIFQHEIDHLNGTLFIDKAKDIKHVD